MEKGKGSEKYEKGKKMKTKVKKMFLAEILPSGWKEMK